MKTKPTVSFNPEYAKSVSKDVFVKQHDHLKDQVDLGKAWEEMQDKKQKETAPVKA